MGIALSTELEHRLHAIAIRRGRSLESILEEWADRQTETFFPADPQRFFELSPVAISVSDAQGVLSYANPALCAMLGYSRDALIARPYTQFVHPDDLAATQGAIASLVAKKSTSSFVNRIRRRDGSYRWLNWAVIFDEPHLYAVAVDITDQKNLEQKLAEASLQHGLLLNYIFDGYLLGDIEGRIREVNQIYCEMIGYSREELLQMTVFDLDSAIDPDQIMQFATKVLQGSVFRGLETQHRRKDGTLIDIEINSLGTENGLIANFIRDISGRKRLERQIRHSEQLYRGLIESQIDLVCRYLPDTTLTYVNDSYCKYFNAERESIIGVQFITLTPEAERPAVLQRLAEVTVNPAPDVRILYTTRSSAKNNWIQWIDYGITDESGRVVEIQAVGRDITPLIEAQHTLVEHEETLASIVNNIPTLLARFDQFGKCQFVNRQWVNVLGWSLEEMQSHPDIFAEFYPEAERRDTAVRFLFSDAAHGQDMRTRTRSGALLDISWSSIKLTDGHRLLIGQDVTHRVQLEIQRIYANQLELELQKERELSELKERFVSLISHEFRTPLSIIKISVDLLSRYLERLPPEKITEKFTTIYEQVQRMIVLMEDTLRLSQNRIGKTIVSYAPIELLPMLERIVESHRQMDENKHRIVLLAKPGILNADAKLLEHIVSNLLSNALKYSPDHSTITLSVARNQNQWHFEIRDEGIGIPTDDLPRLFQPFTRASNVQDRPGTGLGLTIVKDYVELHGGQISVESSLGKGTTFRFSIPERGEDSFNPPST